MQSSIISVLSEAKLISEQDLKSLMNKAILPKQAKYKECYRNKQIINIINIGIAVSKIQN